jgi:hypothetical protein
MNDSHHSNRDDSIMVFYLVGIGVALYLVYIIVKVLLVLFALIGVIVVICLIGAAAYFGHRLALRGVSGNAKQDRKISRDHYLEAQKQLHLKEEEDPKMRSRIETYFEHLQTRVYEDSNLFEDVVSKLKSVKGLFK